MQLLNRCFFFSLKVVPHLSLSINPGDNGFLGISKPVEYGGLGLDYSYEIMAGEAYATIDSGGVSMAIGVQCDMATPALAKFGSHHVKENFLAPTIAGDYVACLGVSEVGSGSDVSSIKSKGRVLV